MKKKKKKSAVINKQQIKKTYIGKFNLLLMITIQLKDKNLINTMIIFSVDMRDIEEHILNQIHTIKPMIS